MRKLFLAGLLMASSFAPALSENMATSGDAAYNAGDYASAIACYNNALENDGSSSDLYYNLGNAYYKSDSIGKAIISYKRALKIDPSYEDALYNLSFLNEKFNLTDGSDSSTIRFFDGLSKKLHPDGWSWLSIGIFALLLTAIGCYLLSRDTKLRKVSFFSALILLPVLAVLISVTIYSRNKSSRNSDCVVVVPSAQLKNAPTLINSPENEAYTVPEGYTLEIVDSVSNSRNGTSVVWYEVTIDGDKHLWVTASDVERI